MRSTIKATVWQISHLSMTGVLQRVLQVGEETAEAYAILHVGWVQPHICHQFLIRL